MRGENYIREAVELLEDYRSELAESEKYLATVEEAEARRGRISEIGEVIEGLTELARTEEGGGSRGAPQGPQCPECHHPMNLLGESCQEAEARMGVEDYLGDGSRYIPVGAHHTGVSCPQCGYTEAEPCIHD